MLRLRHPKWYALLLLALGLVLFVSAAHWQWQRAQFKQARADAFATALRSGRAPPLESVLNHQPTTDFALVQMAGTLDAEHLLLLDNQVQHGVVGVQVFAVLRAAGGGAVLADLGFVARPRDRSQRIVLPRIPATVNGIGLLTAAPAAGLRLGADHWAAPIRYPLLLTRIAPPALRALPGFPGIADPIVRLAPDPASGFKREWKLAGLSADQHRGYALQWASFAIAALVIFFLLHRPRHGVSDAASKA